MKLTLAALMAGSILLAGTPAATHATTLKHFKSSVCPYSINYPSNWTVKSSKSNNEDAFQDNQSSVSSVNIDCSKVSASLTTKVAANQVIAQFKGMHFTMSPLQNFPKENDAVVSGYNHHFTYRGKTFDAVVQVIVRVDTKRLWLISFSGERTAYTRDASLWSAMSKSFTYQRGQ